jgi:hypothetical protein
MMGDFTIANGNVGKAGCKNVNMSDSHQNLGLDIHEMAVSDREDPKTSR